MMNVHPLVQQYVNDVCRQVKARELRKDIKEELESHLEELIGFKQAQGLDDDAAVHWAIAQMGDKCLVAKGLNQVHKPRIPWAMLGSLVLLLTIALVTMYAVELSYKAASSIMGGIQLFVRQAAYMAAGLVVLLGLSRIHYRTLLNFTWTLYGVTIVLMLIVFIWGPQVNGATSSIRLGPITLDVMGISPYLFIVSAAGLLYQRQESWRVVLWHTVLFTMVPLVLFAASPSFSNLVIYAFAYALFLYVSRCGWRWLVPHVFIVTMLFILFVLLNRHSRERLAFFYRHEVSADAGYIYIQIDEAVRSAGWWGHGFASVTKRLPLIHSDTIFTYIVYSQGWFFGIFVLLSALLFVSQLIKAALSVRDTYGKKLINGLGAIFAVQFIWSIGMSLGVLPISAVTLPFISYGGSALLAQLAATGIIYNVYRRKDMIQVR